jgi:hypothetical protein
MENALTLASWSSLEPSARKQLFSQVLIRADLVVSIRDLRHVTSDPLDAYLPLAIFEMEKRMKPAGERAALEAVDLACQILRCRKPEGVALDGYVAILKEVPRDLLLSSIREALAKETHHVLPTPGALLELARPRRLERQRKLDNALHAQRRLDIAEDFRRRGVGR